MSNLIETLRDALERGIENYEETAEVYADQYREALSLLQDPDALLWRLLEERADSCERCAMDNLTPDELHVVTYWELRPFAREEPTETHHTNDLIAIIDRLSHELSEAREAAKERRQERDKKAKDKGAA